VLTNEGFGSYIGLLNEDVSLCQAALSQERLTIGAIVGGVFLDPKQRAATALGEMHS